MHWRTKYGTIVGGALMLAAFAVGQRALGLLHNPSTQYAATRLLGFANAIDVFARLAVLSAAFFYALEKDVFSWLRNLITNRSPTVRKRVKCLALGVVLQFIAFMVQGKGMQLGADRSMANAAHQLAFLADAIALGATVLILRGAIPFALEWLGWIVASEPELQRETPAEQEEPCDSAV